MVTGAKPLLVLIVGAMGLLLAAIGLPVTMFRAERRARRNLYRALGVSEETVVVLMSRGGDVRADLALARNLEEPPNEAEHPRADATPPQPDRHPMIRLVHPAGDGHFSSAPARSHTARRRGL